MYEFKILTLTVTIVLIIIIFIVHNLNYYYIEKLLFMKNIIKHISIFTITFIISYSISVYYISIEQKFKNINQKLLTSNKQFKIDMAITQQQCRIDLLKLKQEFKNSSITQVKVTYYCPWAKGINSDSNPNRTALMTRPKSGYTIAISKELVEQGWLGKKVYVEGFGVGKIEDRMGKQITGKCIDICVGTAKQAMQLGTKLNVNMIKL